MQGATDGKRLRPSAEASCVICRAFATALLSAIVRCYPRALTILGAFSAMWLVEGLVILLRLGDVLTTNQRERSNIQHGVVHKANLIERTFYCTLGRGSWAPTGASHVLEDIS
jgi:hypothetical protein